MVAKAIGRPTWNIPIEDSKEESKMRSRSEVEQEVEKLYAAIAINQAKIKKTDDLQMREVLSDAILKMLFGIRMLEWVLNVEMIDIKKIIEKE